MKRLSKRPKTIENLDSFINMTILGLISNPNYSDVGRQMNEIYKEVFGYEKVKKE